MKPILFNTEMVRATLDGRKKATRRLVKPQPPQNARLELVGDRRHAMDASIEIPGPDDHRIYTPPYLPGDILYVRETWGDYREDYEDGEGPYVLYRADYPDGAKSVPFPENEKTDYAESWDLPKWHPSIHMPREYARIFLRVTDIRAERLWESFGDGYGQAVRFQHEGITLPEECKICIEAYGCPCCSDLNDSLPYDEQTGEDSEGGSECGMLDDVRQTFAELWDSTVEKSKREIYGSDADPWVWVIEYERCERPEGWLYE